ncbi:branched-chain amino acid ABC transporter permease [Desulfonatronum sp. SC1]|uniref:branched-chain amino acid ABC transporter permease n=1 Tax=Desulfonatronum sp. SC1 TaxID=2109626 RepID=UPI000D314040|nr:branched-chain amino acid ABC transporter permease [Desulfonatronum sp. SC1]PTN39034.1 branched-chain amino acid ABC transporter permease [Desulfonatronum sp. SC1]
MRGKCGLFHTSYASETRFFQTGFQKLSLGVFLALLLCSPFFLSNYQVSMLNMINIAVIGAVALNLLTGCCGQISLGHGAFIGVGAYTTGICTLAGWPFFAALLFGGLVTAVVGMLFGIPSLRLKGIYLAIATLAAQLILSYVFLHWESVTGGSIGMGLDAPVILGMSLDNDAKMFYLTFGVAAASVLLVANILRTRHGRAFVAIRDFHQSAESVGVNLFAYKLQAFAVSSFLAGIAGGLWAHYTMYITPEQFDIMLSIQYLAMIIIGGLGSVLGSIFGAVFVTLLPEFLGTLAQWAGSFFPNISMYFLALREGIFGLILVLFLIFEPEGLAHRWRLIKAYWKLYPFAH